MLATVGVVEMVIDISIEAAALFVTQMIGWLGLSTLLFVLFYYTDDPLWEPSMLRHGIFATIILSAFVLIFGILHINWLP